MQSALEQQRRIMAQQQAIREKKMNFEQSRQQGIENARMEDATMKEIMKPYARTRWGGIKILTVVTFIILMFSYNTLFAENKRLYWLFTAVLLGMLIYWYYDMIKNDGGLAVGYLSGR